MIPVLLLTAAVCSSPLDPLLAKLEAAVYMTGSFRQVDFWALTLEDEVSVGTMHLARPDLFRLSYDDPAGAETGFDGSVLYTVEPEVEQVVIYGDREPGSFLHLLEEAGDSTACRILDTGPDSTRVELEGDFGQGIILMEVGFTVSDSLPYLFSTTDLNGNSTTYMLHGITASGSVPQGVFGLVVPEGYETVEPEGT
ncbi:MAG: hypothetical protein AVO35_12195 [Candidatus Aegiribacteria sp. MLS_C]|nr:MAG: hypothetical protein AVO35_12195 [Candidatus Aegiribacteria sp. MLS_C]